MPKVGGRKLFILIRPRLPAELAIGRDSFFTFLRRHDLLVKWRQYRVRTTYSNHWLHKYPNLIKDFTPTMANQLWVSDITYIKIINGFAYLSIVTDAYSRKIVAWSLGDTLEAKYTVEALEMALFQLPSGIKELIYHSDRGVQYCCNDYVKKLKKRDVAISMTESGDPRENPLAESVNGILKSEWLSDMKLYSFKHAREEIDRIINIYNTIRPHSSLDMNTPEYAHKQRIESSI